LLFSAVSYSQTITVDNSTNSPTDLVNLLLGNSCVAVSNISISSNQSVGYFNSNGSSFPINQGIILRSGNILDTQGLYTGANLSTTASGGGSDVFLQNLSNTSSGTTASLQDVSFYNLILYRFLLPLALIFYLLLMNMVNFNVYLMIFCL